MAVNVPAQTLTNKDAVRQAIAQIDAGGMTNLSAGLLRGYQEARRTATDTSATVLLLAELAKGGQGNHVFAEQADGAAQAIAGEIDGLLSKTVQAASLRIRLQNNVGEIKIWNDLPSYVVDGEVVVELGDLWSGEQRKLLLGFGVPARGELGLAPVAELVLRYVLVPDLVEQTVTLPVTVNVVPGDQAAGRLPNPVVISELVFQQAQDAKRQAAEQLRDDDRAGASHTYQQALRLASSRMSEAPSAELAEEVQILGALGERLGAGDAGWSARTSRAEQARKRRTRGR